MAEITQEMMKNARTSGAYTQIWTTTGKCVFCDLKEKYILFEENGIALTINLFPYIDGQMMAIPRRHVKSPKELTEREWETMRKMSYVAKKLIRQVHGHKGMWSLIREGGVQADMSVSDHLHMQFIPFDKSDLCTWNYRELKYTPLENVGLYKKEFKTINKTYTKFNEKYAHRNMAAVVCDLIIINEGKILLQERAEGHKLSPNYLNFPGGFVDSISEGLLANLKREIKEELNYDLDISDINLLDSRVSHIGHEMRQNFGDDKKLVRESHFVWNTYLLKKFDSTQHLVPGDDSKSILWLTKEEIEKSDRLSKESKEVIALAFKHYETD